MMMQMIGSFAEFERAMLQERTRAAWSPLTAKAASRSQRREPKLRRTQTSQYCANFGRHSGRTVKQTGEGVEGVLIFV
jgi:DNA invertase Pin-like site-specific DNA recombinase